MTIPPPGSEPSQLAEFADRLVREAEHHQNRVDFLADAERSHNLYIGNHYEEAAPADQIRIVVNRIQNIIISLVAIQAGDPPKVTFTPRETGEKPITYLNTELPQAADVLGHIASMGATMGAEPIDPMQPLPDDVVMALQADIEAEEAMALQATMMGQPLDLRRFPRELLIEVSDATASKALQTVFDGGWEASDLQFVFCENILNKNVLGWQPSLYEFDDDEKRHIVTNVHPKHVFVDPLNTDSSRWQYAVYDQPISAAEAIAKWPHLKDKIEQNAQEGNLVWAGTRNYETAGMYDQHFERHMVVVRTAWIRYQPYPMTEDQALAKGKIEQREVIDGDALFQESAPTVSPSAVDIGAEIDAVEAAGTAGGDNPEAAAGDPPMDAVLADAQPVPTRSAYFLPGSDEELTSNHPMWPVRYGIRQIMTVVNEAVEDRPCEHNDIPMPANRNVPIPFSPYGQSEPKRLEGLQMAINQVLSAMITHHAYNAYAPELVPEAIVQRMDKAIQKARTKPGQRIVVPAEVMAQLKSLKDAMATLEVPTMPADFWRLLDMLIRLIDQEGNQADVIQGNAQAGWSGEAIESLQNAASQIIRGKSMYTEFYLKRLAGLMVNSIITRMGPEDWRRYMSRYPIQAIQALHSRAKSLHVDISVAIASGSGASKQSETQNLVAARQSGIPISDKTIMERLNVDPKVEQQNTIESSRNQQILNPQISASNNRVAQPANGAGGGKRSESAA